MNNLNLNLIRYKKKSGFFNRLSIFGILKILINMKLMYVNHISESDITL